MSDERKNLTKLVEHYNYAALECAKETFKRSAFCLASSALLIDYAVNRLGSPSLLLPTAGLGLIITASVKLHPTSRKIKRDERQYIHQIRAIKKQIKLLDRQPA